MIANHTSIHTLFERITEQYEKLRKRGAFVDNYKKFMGDSLDEFESSKDSVYDMIK
jgi:tubulin gamma